MGVRTAGMFILGCVWFNEDSPVKREKIMIALVTAKDSVNLLKIMNTTFLGHKAAKELLNELVSKGFVAYNQFTKMYKTTPDGDKWLDQFR
jgi:predicted transcriptional regulator